MTLNITEEIRRALAVAGRDALHLYDPESDTTYVLVPAGAPLPAAAESDVALNETYAMQERVARATGWDAPEMDDYDEYEKHAASRE